MSGGRERGGGRGGRNEKQWIVVVYEMPAVGVTDIAGIEDSASSDSHTFEPKPRARLFTGKCQPGMSLAEHRCPL